MQSTSAFLVNPFLEPYRRQKLNPLSLEPSGQVLFSIPGPPVVLSHLPLVMKMVSGHIVQG